MTDSTNSPLRVLVFGAHPDDAEYHMGGLLALYREAGHEVKVVAATNGDAGHHEMSGPPLAERRKAETEAAMEVIKSSMLMNSKAFCVLIARKQHNLTIVLVVYGSIQRLFAHEKDVLDLSKGLVVSGPRYPRYTFCG